MPRQIAIPTMLMRGGTSRGPFLLASDLPAEREGRDRALRAIMGSPHELQVDGIGGGHPLTSKAGIVAPSPAPGVDLDFTFAQLQPDSTSVQTTANCGNMLSAVLPFAIESGLISPVDDLTEATVRSLNTGLIARITVQTPMDQDGARRVEYEGDTRIAGVPGTGSPVELMFTETAGSVALSLFPTGEVLDTLHLEDGRSIEATLIDNGQPLVLLRAADLHVTGEEVPAALEADTALTTALEQLRVLAGWRMGLGDVTRKSYPKMTLLAPPREGGAIATRSFIPHRVHTSIGVLAAVTVATGLCTPGTVAAELGAPGTGRARTLGIEHPSGVFAVNVRLDEEDRVEAAGITRTARLILAGTAFIPRAAEASQADPTQHSTARDPEEGHCA